MATRSKDHSKDNVFGALATLRDKLKSDASDTLKPAGQRAKARQATRDTAESDAATDAAMFRAELGGVTPMAASDHAEIERAKPAPVPRPKPVEIEMSEAPQRQRPVDPNDTEALFREAMSGVQKLADSNRADTGRRPRTAPQFDPQTEAENDATSAAASETRLANALAKNINDPAALFRHVVGETAPLPDRNKIEPSRPQPAPNPRKREKDEAAVLRESIQAPLSFEDRIDIGDESSHLRGGLPRRILIDLRRGHWVVQDELDLHGLTRDEARSALAHFLHHALEQGFRCTRLIHGKGHGSPGREPVLKHLSRGWLMQREEILAFCQARPHDGGEGALLILLRAPGKTDRATREVLRHKNNGLQRP